MQNSIILDEYNIFNDDRQSFFGRGYNVMPTFVCVEQNLDNRDFDNTHNRNPKKTNITHRKKLVTAMKTKIAISLRKEFGSFKMKKRLACFEKYDLMISDTFYTQVVIKKRIFKNR